MIERIVIWLIVACILVLIVPVVFGAWLYYLLVDGAPDLDEDLELVEGE